MAGQEQSSLSMFNHARVGVGVLVKCPQGYVLLKRIGSHGAGEWSFPGGHLELNETVVDCAIREVKEELGVDIFNVYAPGIFTEDFFPGKHYITLYAIGTTDQIPQIMEPNKASDIAFVNSINVNDLPTPLFSGVKESYPQLWGRHHEVKYVRINSKS